MGNQILGWVSLYLVIGKFNFLWWVTISVF